MVNVSFLMNYAVVVYFPLGCVSPFDDAYFTIFPLTCQAIFAYLFIIYSFC